MASVGGCLTLGSGQAEAHLLEPLTEALQMRGWDSAFMDVEAARRMARLDDVRTRYVELAARRGASSVVGLGGGAAMALVIAEQYAVSSLVLIAPSWTGERGGQALGRLAMRNLFAVVAPTLIVVNAAGEGRGVGVRRITSGLSARMKKVSLIEGAQPLGAAGEARETVIAQIIEHLRLSGDTNSLAN